MMHVSWLTKSRSSIQFLENLTQSQNITLFANPNLQQLIIFMWEITRSFFIYQVFLPFMLLMFIPALMLGFTSVTPDTSTESDPSLVGENWFWVLIHSICLLAFVTGIVVTFLTEVKELKHRGPATYFKKKSNILQWSLLISSVIFLVMVCRVLIYDEHGEGARERSI